MEITTCCVMGSKPKNVIIVEMQLYMVSLNPIQFGMDGSYMGGGAFTMRTQIYCESSPL